MNLFLLDDDLRKSAEFHCDKHMKLGLEATQVVCTVLHGQGHNVPYKPTHKNHPLTKWAAVDNENLKFVAHYAESIFYEYTYRFGKIHKSSIVLNTVILLVSDIEKPLKFNVRTFPVCVAPECIIPGYAVASHRLNYVYHKSHLFKWTKRKEPYWIKEICSLNT